MSLVYTPYNIAVKKKSVKIFGRQKKMSVKKLVGKKFSHLAKIWSLFADFFLPIRYTFSVIQKFYAHASITNGNWHFQPIESLHFTQKRTA